ncbi:MAG: hypothetical protein ABI202_06010 [Candidatus Baltobacteraceae bacterium]
MTHVRPLHGALSLAAITLGAAIFSLVAPAQADQRYAVRGSDTFAIGTGNVRSEISYAGTETLHIERKGHSLLYLARVKYTRVDQGAKGAAKASFTALFLPNGEQRDVRDRDPDYLTVLNQPFSVQLDAATLRDLAHLRTDVPFSFPSPITGSSLHGRLRRIAEGRVDGERALGVSFDAGGPMRGSLPDRPHLELTGRIRMRGSAYYRAEDALLLALDATLTISGNLADPERSDPVRIVYKRFIRAANARPPKLAGGK